MSNEPRDIWYWRNCREIALVFEFVIWPWTIAAYREEDMYGGARGVLFGPLHFGLRYNIGNASSYGLDRFTALSEHEAAERAQRYQRDA